MADFTNALYLGLRHASATLPGWDCLTLGRPAVLAEPGAAREVAAALARLQGTAAATLLPSTLHLFWDLLRQLAQRARTALLLDTGAYPILHWAAEGAAAVGAQVRRFAHHDAAASSSATAFAPAATAPRRWRPTRASRRRPVARW
jgi:8-amino-7-oxononanoate synthase